MVSIIDYGAGNLHSVCNALNFIGVPNCVSRDRDEILAADHILLPGVGAFGDAMASLKKSGLVNTVLDAVESGKPFLGICLGMQMLFENSEESPGVAGLGILKGQIKKFDKDKGLLVPQIGWNDISVLKPESIFGCAAGQFVYFVHSYYLCAEDSSVVAAVSDYGGEFHAAVSCDNISACQFHPEKSGKVGLDILRAWAQ